MKLSSEKAYVTVPWTDENVTQTATTANKAFEVLLSGTNDNTTRTEGVKKSRYLTYNPSTKALSTGGAVNGLTLTAASTGFTIAGGTTSKTLTVNETGTAVLLDATQALTNKTYNGYTLGAACEKGYTDSSSASAISTGTSLVTERDVYYGLPFINGAHAYSAASDFYAPTSAGTSGYWLKSGGTGAAPTWESWDNVTVGSAAKDGDGNTISSTYLKRSGGEMWGDLKLRSSVCILSNTDATLLGLKSGTFYLGSGNEISTFLLRSGNTNLVHRKYTSASAYTDFTIYDSDNANKSTVSWTCASLNINGITTAHTSEFLGFKLYRDGAATGDAGMAYYSGGQTTVCWVAGMAGKNHSSSSQLIVPPDDCFFWWLNGTGFLATLSTSGLFTTAGDQVVSSDIALKKNLMDITYGVEDIAGCRAVTFDWKDGRGRSAGSIAQDWQKLIPELVHGEEGSRSLAYGQLALVNSIIIARHETEQDREIRRLSMRVAELERRLANGME